MSGFAGFYNLDGRPVDRDLLTHMTRTIAHRGPDGEGCWVDGPIGLGHRLLHTTPESLQESQPLASEEHELVIVCDGRMDNRAELRAAFMTEGLTLRTNTDVELILRAYERWGVDCPSHLIGDFAFAIWDRRHHRLFCARDPIGVKPFYYSWDGHRFLFASEIKALLDVPGVAKRMNEVMIADYLLWDFRYPDATFFDGIMQLRPAHTLSLECGQMRLGRYWDAHPLAEGSFQRDDDYLERFRELFREAVDCRLRSHFPVGTMFSGGIDSTQVTAMAGTLRHAHSGFPPLSAFTMLYEGVSQKELAVVQTVAQRFGTEVHFVQPETRHETLEACLSEWPGEAFLAPPPLLESLAAKGCRVALTGYGADELLGPSEDGVLKDLLRKWQLLSLVREVRRRPGRGIPPRDPVLLDLLREQIPPHIKGRLKALLGRQVPFWIEPSFAKRVGLAQRWRERTAPTFSTMCDEDSFKTLMSPLTTLELNMFDGAASHAKVEWRYPFFDRRLIECFFSVPFHVKMRAGPQKRFAMLALADLAPYPAGASSLPLPDSEMSRMLDFKQMTRPLGPPTGPLFRYVNYQAMMRLMRNYIRGDLSVKTHLWKMRDLQSWMEKYFPEEMLDQGHAVEGARHDAVASLATA